MEDTLARYAGYFGKLRRDRKNGGAPHKPVLLLAICRMIEEGSIRDNRIFITPDLVLAFKDAWSRLVVSNHRPNFALPYFHMRSEPFWRLVCLPGLEVAVTSSGSVKSFANLKATVAWAEIDRDLFALLDDAVSNAILVQFLLDTYFTETQASYKKSVYSIGDELERQIVNESAAEYRLRIEELERSLTSEELEEEIFTRSGVFKREIPRLYDYTCAVSGQRIESLRGVQMVDACHIVPFALSKDDTIANGISLTPTLHRAFDRNLLTIDQNYRVRISEDFIERDSPFSLRQFHGKKILLPERREHWPDLEGLKKHSLRTY
jgi:putative restriction endonuclease